MSRPWNVLETSVRQNRRSARRTARRTEILSQGSGMHSVIGGDEPRTGPVAATGASRWPPRAVVAADARIDHDEVYRAGRKLADGVGEDSEPATTSCGGTLCVISTSVASGTMPRITPFTCAT